MLGRVFDLLRSSPFVVNIMKRLFLPLVFLSPQYVFAQDDSQNPAGWASFSGGSSLCNGTFAQANGVCRTQPHPSPLEWDDH